MKNDICNFENEYIKVLQINYDKSNQSNNTYCDVLCKRCGNVWTTNKNNIKRIKSCGCLMKTKWKESATKHIGEKYGSLTITDVDWDRTESTKNNKNNKVNCVYYFVKCDCGKTVEHSIGYNTLKSGHTKSCGCSKFNNSLIMEDLTGQHNNRLTVICRDIERDKKEINKKGSRSGNAHWLCKCDCGNPNLISITGWNFKTGGTKSCGCLAREILIERNKKYSSKYNHSEKYKDNINVEEDNKIKIYDENKEFYFLIDKEDYDSVSKYYWRKIGEEEPNPRKRYWVTNEKKENIDNGSPYSIRLHQIIARNKFGEYNKKEYMPDHLDRNPDNNTRENLYLKTNMENSHNRGISRNNKSGKTGVCFITSKNKWNASITVNYNSIHLGDFDRKEDAILARKKAEEKYNFTCDDVFPEYDLK